MVLGRAVAIPSCYVPGHYALSGASVDVGEGLYGHAKFPEQPEEEEALLCRLDCLIYVGKAGQVVGYCQSEERDALHPLNLSSIDVDGGVFSFLSEVDDQFFGFANVERQIVFHVLALTRQLVILDLALIYVSGLMNDLRVKAPLCSIQHNMIEFYIEFERKKI
eukprot:g23030.t1